MRTLNDIKSEAVAHLVENTTDRILSTESVKHLRMSVAYCVDSAARYLNEETLNKLPVHAWANLSCSLLDMKPSERRANIVRTVLEAAIIIDSKPKLKLVT